MPARDEPHGSPPSATRGSAATATQLIEPTETSLGDDGFPTSGCLRRLDLGLNAQQSNDRLRPEGEDARRQPPVEHERPVEWNREDLLGDPEAVAPLVHRHLEHLSDRCGDEEEEGPREALLG